MPTKKRRRLQRQYHHSFVLGVISDARILLSLGSIPIHAIGDAIHHELKKRHPWLRRHHRHVANVIYCALGVILMIVTFVIEHYSQSTAYRCGIETARTIAVAPVTEIVATLVRVERDI